MTIFEQISKSPETMAEFMLLHGKNCAICSIRNVKCDGMCKTHIKNYLNSEVEDEVRNF